MAALGARERLEALLSPAREKVSGHLLPPARALIWRPGWHPGFEQQATCLPPRPRVPGGRGSLSISPSGTGCPAGPDPGRPGSLGEKAELESARPPRAPAAEATHSAPGSSRESLPLLSVSLDYSRACLRRCVAAALEFIGKLTRFLFSSCPLSPPSSDFLTANQYYFLALHHPPPHFFRFF